MANMLQNRCKKLGFKKNMFYKIPPGEGKPYLASGLLLNFMYFISRDVKCKIIGYDFKSWCKDPLWYRSSTGKYLSKKHKMYLKIQAGCRLPYWKTCLNYNPKNVLLYKLLWYMFPS